MNSKFVLSLLLLAMALGCAGATPPARVVRLRDLGSAPPLAVGQPFIIELEEGDTIPLTFTVGGPFLETPPDGPVIPLRVKRHCFLRIDAHGLKSSLDGKNFDWSPAIPGSFRVGLSVTKAGARAEVEVHTPTPPEK